MLDLNAETAPTGVVHREENLWDIGRRMGEMEAVDFNAETR